jgi:DNA-binding transcriptional LysR family regulator
VEQLEAEVGVPLLMRTRAGSVPTDAGALLARRGQELLQDEAAVVAAVREVGDEPQGELQVVVPVGMAPPLIAILFVSMRERYPKVVVRIRTAEDPLAALDSGVDVAVCFDDREPGGRWVSMEVARVRRMLVAAPAYLEQHGTPQTLDDLRACTLLAWTPPRRPANVWPLVGGGEVEVSLVMESPDIHLIRQVAGHGLGIALTPEGGLPAMGLPAMGMPLVPVATHLVGDAVPTRIVVPAALEGRARIRALLGIVRELLPTYDPDYVTR